MEKFSDLFETALAAEVRMSGLGSEDWRYSDADVDGLGIWVTKIQNLNEKEEVMRLRHTMALRLGEGKHTQVLLFDLAK